MIGEDFLSFDRSNLRNDLTALWNFGLSDWGGGDGGRDGGSGGSYPIISTKLDFLYSLNDGGGEFYND